MTPPAMKGACAVYIITESDRYDQLQGSTLRDKRLSGYRVKEVYYGDRMEIEIYPYWARKPRCKCQKLKESRKAAKNQNAKDSRNMFSRLVMNNFGTGDLHVVCTYQEMPDEAQALRDAQNMIRRYQAARRRKGLGKGKYMYVIEGAAEGKRVHLHLVLQSGISRDEVEALWQKGYCNADRIRAIDGSIKGLATYLAKDPKGKKRWGASRGLKKPEVKIYDHKITRKKAREMATDAESFAAALVKLYPNYRATEINPPKYSEFVAGVYLCAEMRRND